MYIWYDIYVAVCCTTGLKYSTRQQTQDIMHVIRRTMDNNFWICLSCTCMAYGVGVWYWWSDAMVVICMTYDIRHRSGSRLSGSLRASTWNPDGRCGRLEKCCDLRLTDLYVDNSRALIYHSLSLMSTTSTMYEPFVVDIVRVKLLEQYEYSVLPVEVVR